MTRIGDPESLEALRGFDVTRVDVSAPGGVNAKNAGLAVSATDVTVFIDEDAAAPADWLRRRDGESLDFALCSLAARVAGLRTLWS